MTASTLDRNPQRKITLDTQVIPLKSGAVIPEGVLVMVNTPSTGADNAADVAGAIVVGLSSQAANQTLGDSKITVDHTVTLLLNGGHITSAHVGINACVVDNQTVDLAANTTNAIVAGKIREVNSDGVFVAVGVP